MFLTLALARTTESSSTPQWRGSRDQAGKGRGSGRTSHQVYVRERLMFCPSNEGDAGRCPSTSTRRAGGGIECTRFWCRRGFFVHDRAEAQRSEIGGDEFSTFSLSLIL